SAMAAFAAFDTPLDIWRRPRRNMLIRELTAWMCASEGASGPVPNSSRLKGCKSAACLVRLSDCVAVHEASTSSEYVATVRGVWTAGGAAGGPFRGRISAGVAMGLYLNN